jgi:hypothetical protein
LIFFHKNPGVLFGGGKDKFFDAPGSSYSPFLKGQWGTFQINFKEVVLIVLKRAVV